MRKGKKTAVFISSTGGHFVELMSMKPIFEYFDYYIINDKTKASVSLKKEYGKRVNFLIFGNKEKKLEYIFKMTYNTFKCLYLFFTIRPDVVITTGAHTSMPMCIISKVFGWMFRTKLVFIETYANSQTKTKSGKFLYHIADLFVVQWENMLNLYPNAKYLGGIF